MSDRLTAHGPPTNKNIPALACCAIGMVIVAPLLLISVLGSLQPGAPPDSGLAGCTSLSSAHYVAASDYPKIRAQFAGSRWPDLRTAGTAYVDLAIQLRTARGPTDTRPSGSTSGCLPPARGTGGRWTPAPAKTITHVTSYPATGRYT